MRAFILAAGMGTRLKRYTATLPKGMLKFAGKTLIERQIEVFRNAGVSDICVCTGYKAETIQYEGVEYRRNDNYENTNMVESLMCARDLFDQDAIVSYADLVFDNRVLNLALASRDDFAVCVDEAWRDLWIARYGTDTFDTESLTLDSRDAIVELGRENVPPQDQMARYIGVLKFSRHGLQVATRIYDRACKEVPDLPWMQSQRIPRKASMTDLLEALIREGYEVHALKANHGWLEFDTEDDYERAQDWFETGNIGRFVSLK